MRIFKSLLYYVAILLPLVCIAGLVINPLKCKDRGDYSIYLCFCVSSFYGCLASMG